MGETQVGDSVPRAVHYLPERRGGQSICAASVVDRGWTADAREITCPICAAMLLERLRKVAGDYVVHYPVVDVTTIPSGGKDGDILVHRNGVWEWEPPKRVGA